MYHLLSNLSSVFRLSYLNDDGLAYGHDEDEGDPGSLDQLPTPEICYDMY